MGFFTKLFVERLYVAQPGSGFFYYVLPKAPEPPRDSLELAEALTAPSLGGTFVVTAGDPGIEADSADAFVEAVLDAVRGLGQPRGFVWLSEPKSVSRSTTAVMGLTLAGDGCGPLTATLLPSLLLTVTGGTSLALAGTDLILSGGLLSFQGPAAPICTAITSARLPCAGSLRGTLRFTTDIQRQSLYQSWNWGLQYAVPSTVAEPPTTALWLPLAASDAPSAGDQLGFDAAIDPSDPTNRFLPDRTTLTFTGTMRTPEPTEAVLVSGFATTTGATVWLYPVPGPLDSAPDAARLVFTPGCQADRPGPAQFQAAPVGAFELAVPGAPEGLATLGLMGGLHGTEYVSFRPRRSGTPGDRLWFAAGQPAYAPRFPFPPASPVAAPVAPDAPLLEADYRTSWATVIPGAADPVGAAVIPYVAQPKGAPLLGRDGLIYQTHPSLWGSMDPAVALPGSRQPFPLAPYGLATAGDGDVSFSSNQIAEFEAQVLAATRRTVIGTGVPLASARATRQANGARMALAAAPDVTTTPSGQLVTLAPDGRWQEILLGQILPGGPDQTLAFLQPQADVQQAFSTGDLFLVIANATRLGTLGPNGGGPAFLNQVTIGGWPLTATVGVNHYNDYRNVIIVKGRKGALYDPTSAATQAASLVSAQDKWTLASTFGAPSDLNPAEPSQPPGPPDPMELPVLSAWLRGYFQAASEETDTAYFGPFNALARDPNWTGILILAMDCGLPPDLAGLAAGIADPARFRAHHLGIRITPVANDPSAASISASASSSMFGLIHYQDPEYRPPAGQDPVQPVPVAAGPEYAFKVLTLKVLFENTAVKLFQSYAQVTLNTLFGMPVVAMGSGGNDANAIILRGTYQNNSGTAVYSMGALYTTTYLFLNNIINKIEIDTAQLSTVNDGSGSALVQSLFSFSGYLDFTLIKGLEGGVFDVFSFGNDAGADALRRGLRFNNLGLLMSFAPATPTDAGFRFITDDVTFDPSTSTPRPGCLYSNFALTLSGLVQGDGNSPPSAADWLTVAPGALFRGVDGGPWYGLTYRLDMGTPGALAGKAKLTSQLLTAWSTSSVGDGSYQALIGIQLPGTGGGAKLISLQNVLKLSIGQIHLAYDADKSSFLLMLTEIALRFLGLLKIPTSGSTLFYLFGNPQADGKPTGLGWYALYNNEPKAS